jgi:hypothetical protein
MFGCCGQPLQEKEEHMHALGHPLSRYGTTIAMQTGAGTAIQVRPGREFMEQATITSKKVRYLTYVTEG